MKKTVIKKIISEIFSIIFVPCILLCVMLVFENSERFVTYSSAKPSDNIKDSTTDIKQTSTTLLKREYSLQILPEGKYTVVSRNDEICVLDKNGENVYVVNARFDEFPEGDRLVLEKGIEAENKAQLEKIIAYLES